MGKLKTFFQSFVKSLTQPSYYNDILSAKFSFSLKYLFFLVFLLSLVGALKFAVNVISLRPKLPEFVDNAKKVVMDIYPEKLILTYKGGKISTNVKEPYYIDMPEEGKGLGLEGMHLVAIDTKGSAEEYQKYNSAILLTDESAVIPDNENGNYSYKMYPLADMLKDVPDGSFLNKTLYQTFASLTLPYIDKLPVYLMSFALVAVLLWPFFGALFSLSGYMFYLLVFTLLLWVIAKIMKKNLSYGKVYQLSLHGLTLPIIASSLIALFGKPFPFLFSVIFVVFMIVVFTRISPRKVNA